MVNFKILVQVDFVKHKIIIWVIGDKKYWRRLL